MTEKTFERAKVIAEERKQLNEFFITLNGVRGTMNDSNIPIKYCEELSDFIMEYKTGISQNIKYTHAKFSINNNCEVTLKSEVITKIILPKKFNEKILEFLDKKREVLWQEFKAL